MAPLSSVVTTSRQNDVHHGSVVDLEKVPSAVSLAMDDSSEKDTSLNQHGAKKPMITKMMSSSSSLLDACQVTILVELVGACNLSLDDDGVDTMETPENSLLRPYCTVQFGKQTIHATRMAQEAGPNPIWTLDTQSLFLLELSADELAHEKLCVSVWSKPLDTIVTSSIPFPTSSTSVFLGRVLLDGSSILSHCNEERLELNLYKDENEDSDASGTLALRFRFATQSDVKFVKAWQRSCKGDSLVGVPLGSSAKKTEFARQESKLCLLKEEETEQGGDRQLAQLITEEDETQLMGASVKNAFEQLFSFRTSNVVEKGLTKRRVKPSCDPTRPETTTYMTPHDIKSETRLPSLKWTEAGSGNLGKLYLEILSCQDLPNVDVGEAVGNVTDSFVAAVFEDALVQTPVIDDELSPRWLPWTERAFCFGIMHPASTLYIGVFDYDLGPLSSHDPIGRAAVNISNLKRDTVYTLKYNLYPSSNVTDRNAQGTITIRLRIEMNDEKEALMAALRPRPKIHVNVQKEKSFNVLRYTCYGEQNNDEQFELTVLRSYINEIFEYKSRVTYSIGDALRSLIFWRGQVKVLNVWLPIDSFMFFCAATTLVERPCMFPAYLLLSVAWILLANMRSRTQDPSPWNQCLSFWHYLRILKTGHSGKPRRIDAMEGHLEAQAQQEAWRKRMESDLKAKEKNAAMQKTLNEIGDDKINTAVPGSVIPIDLLARLGRYQGIIGGICRKFRLIRTVLLWEESIISFWITAVFLAAGVVALFLPWAFILAWTGRILVYGFCGPHMKLVDLLWVSASDGDHKNSGKHLIKFQQLKNVARIRREEALKLKAAKSLRFGQYIILVPDFNLARHYDRPLPQSTARHWRKSSSMTAVAASQATMIANDSKWIPGQQLYGVMIPRPEKEAIRNQELSFQEKERLHVLEARLVALKVAAACGGGIQTSFGRRILHLKERAETEEREPDASGYELIPCVNSVLESTQDQLQCSSSDLAASPHMDVMPSQFDLAALAYEGMGLRRVSVALEDFSSYFPSVAEIVEEEPPKGESLEDEEVESVEEEASSRSTSSEHVSGGGEKYEEEGVEIVACEEFLTSGRKEKAAIVEHEFIEVVGMSREKVGELSAVYRSSDNVAITFYRAPGAG